jgi:hypothetical protein
VTATGGTCLKVRVGPGSNRRLPISVPSRRSWEHAAHGVGLRRHRQPALLHGKTMMVIGDAKKVVEDIVKAIE